MVFDANNQYGWAMCQYLPTGGFEWVHLDTTSPEYWTKFVNEQQDKQDLGYFFNVDLEYPKELHDLHDAYPLALWEDRPLLSRQGWLTVVSFSSCAI